MSMVDLCVRKITIYQNGISDTVYIELVGPSNDLNYRRYPILTIQTTPGYGIKWCWEVFRMNPEITNVPLKSNAFFPYETQEDLDCRRERIKKYEF